MCECTFWRNVVVNITLPHDGLSRSSIRVRYSNCSRDTTATFRQNKRIQSETRSSFSSYISGKLSRRRGASRTWKDVRAFLIRISRRYNDLPVELQHAAIVLDVKNTRVMRERHKSLCKHSDPSRKIDKERASLRAQWVRALGRNQNGRRYVTWSLTARFSKRQKNAPDGSVKHLICLFRVFWIRAIRRNDRTCSQDPLVLSSSDLKRRYGLTGW